MEYKSAKYTIEIDLTSDLNKMAYNYLVGNGFQNVSLDQALLQYCYMDIRLLSPKPRKVFVARELKCPDAYKEKYEYFKSVASKGGNLQSFMSKSILDVTFKDKMIFDWGLYHFHLSSEIDADDNRFMARSDYLLIAYVGRDNDDNIYFLQIRPHVSSVWTEQELIRILVDNWPETMEKHRIQGYAALTENITDQDYKLLRKNNVNSFVDLHDGRVYHGANGGLNTAGTSVRAVIKYDHIFNEAKRTEILIGDIIDDVGDLINKKLETHSSHFRLKLVKFEHLDYIFEINGYGFPLRLIDKDKGAKIMIADTISDIEALS